MEDGPTYARRYHGPGQVSPFCRIESNDPYGTDGTSCFTLLELPLAWARLLTSLAPQNQSNISLAGLLQNAASQTGAKVWADSDEAIAVLHKRDDADIWRGWRRHLFRLVPLLTFFNTGIYLVYLALRIMCVLWAQRANDTVYAAAWVFIAIEIAVAVPSLMHNSWTMWSMKKRNRQKLRLKGYHVPTVDVFVTCCSEDDDIVMDTVRAACDIDYPYDRFRVVVLDDGNSASLKASLARLAMSYPNFYYMAREKIPGKPHHFKAGNLNYGLEQVNLLPGCAGRFMAALDADMVCLACPPLPQPEPPPIVTMGSALDPGTRLALRRPPPFAGRSQSGTRLPAATVLQHAAR